MTSAVDFTNVSRHFGKVRAVDQVDLSIREGWIDENVRERSIALLERAALPIAPPAEISADQFLEVMAIDKKTIDGKITLVLLRELGEAFISADYDHDKLLQTLSA